MLRRFLRSISSVLIVSLVATSIPTPGKVAWAQAAICNSVQAERGEQLGCAVAKLEGGRVVAYPKLQWELIADMPSSNPATGSALVSSPETITYANRAAVALGLDSNQVATVIQMFPANVPVVFARYNPMDLTLRIDIFKLEKAAHVVANNSGSGEDAAMQMRAGLYHATFTPAHGDFWRASRAYIHPDRRLDGNYEGVNPFTRFKSSSTPELFTNITIAGAQVAVGHAMRYVRAPISILSVAQARYETRVEKSGNAFRRKVTTYVDAYVKSAWMIGYPRGFQSRSTALPMAAYCATDPTAKTCPLYEVASAGVVFEEFEGGTLSEAEHYFEDVWHQSKSGFGFLAILAIAVVLSFTIAGALTSAGLLGGSAATSGVVAGQIAGEVATTTLTGIWGSVLGGAGIVTGANTAMAVLIESTVIGALMSLGGANLSSMMSLNSGLEIAGDVSVVSGYATKPDLDKIQRPTSERISPFITSDMAHGGSLLRGFKDTVVGDCAVGKSLSECGVGATGVILRHDQYIEQNQVEFLRDNGGRIIRNDSPIQPKLPVQPDD